MSRSLAAVIGVSLGFPILAMIAISVASGLNPDFLMRFLIGGVVTAFVIGALFEIKRLADADSKHLPERHEIVAVETPAPEVHDVSPAPDFVWSQAEKGVPILVAGGSQDISEVAVPETGAEPIIVERAKVAATPKKKRTGGKSGPRKSPVAPGPKTSSEAAQVVVAKSKRKPAQRKSVTTT